jgi:hypothetical protein
MEKILDYRDSEVSKEPLDDSLDTIQLRVKGCFGESDISRELADQYLREGAAVIAGHDRIRHPRLYPI